MTRKLTRITSLIDGYAVVVVQKEGGNGQPGEFLGFLLETPERSDDGPFMLLANAMGAYLKFTSKSQSSSTGSRVTTSANKLCTTCEARALHGD